MPTQTSTNQSSLAQAKANCRTHVRADLGQLTPDEAMADAIAVRDALLAHEVFKNASTVLLYAPIAPPAGQPASALELNVWRLFEPSFAAGKRVCLPRMDWDAGTMLPVAIDRPDHPTQVIRYGVPEPVGGTELSVHDLDLVIVPGLAFDRNGKRLGRGAGFYDRFLSPLAAKPRAGRAVLVGVGFSCQLVDDLPTEAHDIPVDLVLAGAQLIMPNG